MTRKNKPHLPEGDDGRTIASMNVEGMPWYRPEQTGQRLEEPENQEPREGASKAGTPLSRQEAREYTFGAMKAALLVTGVMCLGLVLFILFCQFVWFRK